MPAPEFDTLPMQYIGALGASEYLSVVKIIEMLGGAMVLSGRLVPLGLVLVTPDAVNIARFDIFLEGQLALGVFFSMLCSFLAWTDRSHFAGVFAVRPRIG